MKRLQEYIEEQQITQEDDFSVIQRYLTENGLELEAISMITELANSASNRLQSHIARIHDYLPMMPNMRDYFEDKKTADMLNALQQYCIIGYHLKDMPSVYEWAKENIPKMRVPMPYYRYVSDYLAKYGIHFMGAK